VLFNDPTFLLLIPVLILVFWAQANVKGTYEKYKKVPNSVRITGKEVAERLLSKNGIYGVPVLCDKGELTDHYHPSKREVVLSSDVYHGTSIAAISIAAHEVGHAIQHDHGYSPVVIRGSLLPVANIGSQAGIPMFFIGLLFQFEILMTIGIIFFAFALLFHLVTLPVEFNASRRAIAQLTEGYTTTDLEVKQCRKMLNAAAMTYVASTLMILIQLIRLILLRNSRR